MKFNQHHKLEGLHAPFSASSSHWLRYDDDKVIETYHSKKAAQRGTELIKLLVCFSMADIMTKWLSLARN